MRANPDGVSESLPSAKISKENWPVWGLLALNIGLGLSYCLLWAVAAFQGVFWRADFSAYYTGWTIVKNGQGKELYDLDLQRQCQQDILGENRFYDGLLPFTYPPHMALFLSPFAFLPRSASFIIWTIVNCFLLLWLIQLLSRLANDWLPVERRLMISGVLGLHYLFLNFMLGAFSLMLLICLMQFYLSLKDNRQSWSAFWLVLGTIKPQNILFPAVALLGSKRWKAVGTGILMGVMIFLTTSFLLGWRVWLDFLKLLRSLNNMYGYLGMEPRSMYTFKGLLTGLLGEGHGTLINLLSWTALVGSVFLVMGIWHGRWTPLEPVFEARLALTLLLGMFFNLYLFPQDGLLLVLPVVLFYDYLRRCGLPHRIYAACVLLCPLIFLISEFTIGSRLGIRIPVAAMVILIVWVGKTLIRETRSLNLPPPPQPIP